MPRVRVTPGLGLAQGYEGSLTPYLIIFHEVHLLGLGPIKTVLMFGLANLLPLLIIHEVAHSMLKPSIIRWMFWGGLVLFRPLIVDLLW